MPDQTSKIAVLGGGTWGISLASVLAWKGLDVHTWDIDSELINQINSTRKHPKLNGFSVPENMTLTADFDEVLNGAECIVIVTPSIAMRSVAQRIKDCPTRSSRPMIIICTKGIEIETHMPMAQVCIDVLGPKYETSIGVLSGPSHAEEVSKKLPTTVAAAAEDPALAQYIQQLFHTPEFRVYTNNDVLGVELGGSLKNVIAIAAGACDGMGFGDNTRAAIITRGLNEMRRLGKAMGAKDSTLFGLAGIGDLIVTATSKHSRNRKFGELLTSSESVEMALKQVDQVVEGMPTSKAAVLLAEQYNVDMPITNAVKQVIYDGLDPKHAMKELMMRDARPEDD